MNRIAAIVVTHNSEAHIGACLDAIVPCMPAVVVDNASIDSTLAHAGKHRSVRIIANDANLGFAAAVNQAVRSSNAEYLLLLNPDAVYQGGLADLTGACERTGIAAGKLVGLDGRAQSGFSLRRFPTPAALSFEALGFNRLWPGNPVNRKYRYLERDLELPGPVEQPAGAFLMFRRDLFERIGGFDESFFPVWFEDVDFVKRASAAGYPAEYVPSAEALHEGGHSVGQLPPECRTLYWYVSLLRYAEKHFRNIGFRVACGGVAAGCLGRSVVGIFGERKVIAVHGNLVRLALVGLLTGKLHSEAIRVEKRSKLEEGAGLHVRSHPARR